MSYTIPIYPKDELYTFELGGNPHSVSIELPNGLIAYSEHDFNSMQAMNPDKRYHPPMSWEVLYTHIMDWDYRQYVGKPALKINKQAFTDALEVLPPCRWDHTGGLEHFHISERIISNLVNWYVSIDNEYFTFADYDDIDSDQMAARIEHC